MAKHCSKGLEFLCKKFPKLGQAKLKKNLVGQQIRKVFEDAEFKKVSNTLELQAWCAFK